MNLMSRHGFENGFPENFSQKMRMEQKRINRHNTLHYRKTMTKVMLLIYAAECVMIFSSSMV